MKQYVRGLFRSKPVVHFLKEFDEFCFEALESVFTVMKNHAEPIIAAVDMQSFIDRAPKVFGDYWELECEMRGAKLSQKSEKERNIPRVKTVFFLILARIRQANRRKLQYWAVINNISDYSRGVKASAEKAAAFHGHHVHPTMRRRIIGRLTGNNKKGRADKQRRLLGACKAIALCFDNFQRGVSLLNQRGEHSLSFFKGTHQCTHQVRFF